MLLRFDGYGQHYCLVGDQSEFSKQYERERVKGESEYIFNDMFIPYSPFFIGEVRYRDERDIYIVTALLSSLSVRPLHDLMIKIILIKQ